MRPGRRPVILALVAAHFVASIVAVVPERSALWRLRPLAEVRRFYATHNLDQRWNMFAPPPRQHVAILAAFQFAEGWTGPYPLDDFSATRLRGRLILDRGLRAPQHRERRVPVDPPPEAARRVDDAREVAIELAFAALVFWPPTRWLALGLVAGLQVRIDLLMSIRLFGPVMYLGLLAFVRPAEWLDLASRLGLARIVAGGLGHEPGRRPG